MTAGGRDLFGVDRQEPARPKIRRKLRARPLPGHVLTGGSHQAPIRDRHDVIVGAVVATGDGRYAAWAHRRKIGVFDSAREAEIEVR